MINRKDLEVGDTVYTCFPNMNNKHYPVQVLDIFTDAMAQTRLLITIKDEQGIIRELDATWISKYPLNQDA